MNMLDGKQDRRRFLAKAFRLAVGGAVAFLLPGCAPGTGKSKPASPYRQTHQATQRPEAWIDCHAHLQPLYPIHGLGLSFDWPGAVKVALSRMDQAGIYRTVLMPPPMMPRQDETYDAAELRGICAENKDRFVFLAGGGSLNPMIHQAWLQGSLEPKMERRFRDTAEKILAMGAAGFGEMAAEHFSFSNNHPYESAPPNHPLFMLLADIAAENNVPIDLHMEAVPQAMDLPPHLASPPNAKRLRPNIDAFEKLLQHNRRACIFWSHVGWGHTGMRTPALCQRLLKRHPNLFMSFKTHRHSTRITQALDHGRLRTDWLNLVRLFPDRFVMGSDQFYQTPQSPRRFPNSLIGALAILRSLPSDLAAQVGRENPPMLFRGVGG